MQNQIRVRLTLDDDLHAQLMALPPALRSQAVSTVLSSVMHGVDLPRVAAATEQMRRLGVLLNQALHHCYTGHNFNSKRVIDLLDFFDRLRGPLRR
jgi:hypothetical protein